MGFACGCGVTNEAWLNFTVPVTCDLVVGFWDLSFAFWVTLGTCLASFVLSRIINNLPPPPGIVPPQQAQH